MCFEHITVSVTSDNDLLKMKKILLVIKELLAIQICFVSEA